MASSSWQVVTVCVTQHVVNGVSAVQVLADQPFSASRRRQLLLNFLQAKLEAEDEQLLLEGARVSMATAMGGHPVNISGRRVIVCCPSSRSAAGV
jgi:hypothetical protein